MSADADKPTVALVGFLDTKGEEHAFVADLLRSSGCTVLVLDVSITDVRSPNSVSILVYDQ
jgi:uncharacterized protein (UPF0261 family)